MTKKKIFLLIGIIIVFIVIVVLLSVSNNNNDEVELKVEKSYYDYFNFNGTMNIDIERYVKLPENYQSNYTANSVEESMTKIINDSEVQVPEAIIETYRNEMYEELQQGANENNLEIEEYLMKYYEISSVDSYLDFYNEYNIEEIKKEMVYQALAKDLEIKVTEEDVKDYFKELLNTGTTYEQLKDNYGEKLMYIYTLEDIVKKEIFK